MGIDIVFQLCFVLAVEIKIEDEVKSSNSILKSQGLFFLQLSFYSPKIVTIRARLPENSDYQRSCDKNQHKN